jgi:hypothetical protein
MGNDNMYTAKQLPLVDMVKVFSGVSVLVMVQGQLIAMAQHKKIS